MTALADVLRRCPGIRMEIGGHTDSQGRDESNLALSQARAEAVLLALQGRQVDVSGLVAKGYGETVPIADNETEAGREANRRIEFVPIGQPAPAVPGTEDATTPAEGADAAAEGPDFSGDDSPSVAPAEKTIRPQPRPAQD